MVLKDIIKDLKVLRTEGPLNIDIDAIAYDSRQVTPRSLFFCIDGYQKDGHDFAIKAVNKGANAVVLTKNIVLPDYVVKVFVDNPRRAMGLAATNFYGKPTEDLMLLGVTGTNGKTTTTYLIKSILDQAGIRTGLIGTIKNIVGEEDIPSIRTTPEPLVLHKMFRDMVSQDIKAVVMEVSSHSLELDKVAGCRFETAVFTNLTRDHLDFHGNFENYYAAKKKLFKLSRTGIVNLDDESGRRILEDLDGKNYTYGIDNNADIYASDIDIRSQDTLFKLFLPDHTSADITMQTPGLFSVYNGLAAASACHSVGLPIADIKKGLELIRGVPGRFELLDTGTDYSVIIDYAHTPDGLRNILTTARELADGRLIILFGCGGDRDWSKREIMGQIAGEYSDYCIVTSDNPRGEEPMEIIEQIVPGVIASKCHYKVIEDRKEAIAFALSSSRKDDILILAGKGHETYQVLRDKTINFDEKEIVAELLGREQV
ncbi:MAG TPA: UDP-N-acetylmuramoyl-L-alanyl-D-glutamate--2,6-diaminopimelate ligase [Bacillota bacterium]|nr:UDP-N-acetylmuramoyl-L-alanyl-D-glutamate--2,6-diaminopimelate ligase [Bacillota bacterium]